MKRTLRASIIALSLLLLPATTEAKTFELWASALGGGHVGNGTAHRDFFAWAKGPTVGVEGGISFLFFNVYVDYTYFFGGDAAGTLLGFNLGGDSEYGLTDDLSLVLRLAGTVYLGNLQDDKPRAGTQLTSNQIHTTGTGVRGGIGLRYSFWKLLSVGITPQIGYHTFFAGAPSPGAQAAHGWDFQAMGYLRASLGI